MKKLNKFLIALTACLLMSVLAYAAPEVVKSTQLSTKISTTGSVRVVVKVTEQFTGFDMGVILHKEAFSAGWNQGLSTVIFNHSEKQIRGYNGDIPNWVYPESTKIFEIGDTVALWLTIDIANKTHTLHAQLQSETEVTTVFEDFQFRASVKGEPYDTANFCTVFVNDRMGENASQAIEVIEDATVVDQIEPYFPLEVFNETEGLTTDGIYTIHCKGKKTFMADATPGRPMAMKDSASFADNCKFYIVVNPADSSKYNIITLDGRYVASTTGGYGTLIENTAENRNSTLAAVDILEQTTNEYFIETYPIIGNFDGTTLKRWNGQRGGGTQLGMGGTGSDNYKWNLTRIGDMPASNVAPTAIFLSADNIDENNAANDTIGMLSASDANPFDTHMYSLATGDGTNDIDNGSFSISGNMLTINDTADFETKASYSINIKVSDNGGLSFDKAFTISVNDVDENTAPTGITLSDTSLVENNVPGITVGTLSASDADAEDTFTFTFEADSINGADNDAFTITGDALSINESTDYETKSEYKINVKVTDAGGLSFVKAFIVTINEFIETEGLTTDGIYTIHCKGKKTFMSANGTPGKPLPLKDSTNYGDDCKLYILTNPSDSSKINIITLDGRYVGSVHEKGYGTWIENTVANRDSSIAAASLLEQAPNEYYIETFLGNGSQKLWNGQRNGSTAVGMGTSGGNNYTWNLTRVGDMPASNVAPTAIFLSVDSIAEGNAANDTIGMLSVADANPFDTHMYSLATGDGTNDIDNGSFSISGNMLTINDTADFETKASYSINIKVSDNGGLSFDKAFTISVNDVDENTAPTGITLSDTSLVENNVPGITVGTLSASDADAEDTFTFTFEADSINGADNDAFTITGDALSINESTDYETKSEYKINVKVTDAGGLSFVKAFIVTINEFIETEGLTTDGIYTIHCKGKKTFMSANGTPGKPLPLKDSTNYGDDCKLYIVTNPSDSSKINIITLDGRYVGSVHEKGYGTWIENTTANRDSSIAAASLLEQAPNEYYIETFLGNGSQKLWNGQRNGSTAVGMGTSGGNNYTWNLTRVGDMPASNVAPTAIFLSVDSIAEGNAANDTIGMLSVADANPFDTHMYSLATGDGTNDIDNGSFSISGNMLTINDTADFETKASYNINIEVSDDGGLTFVQAYTILITDVMENTAPTAIALSLDSIAEDAAVGTLVGILTATDADANSTFTYTLSGADAASFVVVDDSLKSAEIFDFETKTSYSITVTVSDGELTFDQDFTINVSNVVETSIGAIELSKLSFYPNPVKDRLTVSGLTVDATAHVYTVNGTLVKVAQLSSIEKSIDFSELSPGTYIFKLTVEGGELVTKIIK